MARTSRPGSAPTYVRRWPRISASSRTPPSDTRTNFRPSARATDSPSEVLPTPGGPTSASTAPADDLEAAGGAPGPDGQVLHDAVLHVGQAVVVGVEHLAGGRDVRGVLGPDVPRDVEHGVEPGADPARLRVLVAGPLELADLAQRGGLDLLGQVGGLDAGAVVRLLVGRAGLAELLADRGQLLAQQELPLRLVHRLAHVVADLRGHLGLGQVGPRPLQQQRQPLLD